VRAVGSARCLKLDYGVFNEFAVHCGPILAQRAEMYAEQQKAQHAAEVHFEEAKIAAAVDAGGGMHYRALKPAIIRVGVGTDSPKVAGLGGKLHEGDVFEALETKQIDGGRMRIRMVRGWVSVTSTSGLPLCVGEAAVQGFLKSVPLLKPLLELQRAAIARQLELMDIADAATVVAEGEVGHAMYFVESGVLQVEKDGVIVMEYARGDWFGELALLSDAPRSATVRAKGDARCLKLEKARPFQGRGPHSRLYCGALPTQPARGFGVWGRAAAEGKIARAGGLREIQDGLRHAGARAKGRGARTPRPSAAPHHCHAASSAHGDLTDGCTAAVRGRGHAGHVRGAVRRGADRPAARPAG
jgi:cAMP-dependent protein kinase regulator